MAPRKKLLSSTQLQILFDALHYFHMPELKDLCQKLKLPTNGKKGEILQRICQFLRDGTILKKPSIPAISCSKDQKGKLAPSALILKGSYKNDDLTRQFMKTLVGNHFHFTAFGQDWIQTRWLEGNPPTYAEFAAFWQSENDLRTKKKASPKQEWAYLNFLQKLQTRHPSISQESISDAWEKERLKQKEKALDILEPILNFHSD